MRSAINHIHFKKIKSTQDVAIEKISDLVMGTWLLYTADEQTKGRGTGNRSWASPPNVNIYATYSFLVEENSKNLCDRFLTTITGYSIATTVEGFNLKPKIKWPNDVLLNRKKISGVLANCHPYNNYYSYHIGIGINVNMEQDICDSLDQPVTSMKLAAQMEFNKAEVLEALSENLYGNVNKLLNEGFFSFINPINSFLETYDRGVIEFDENNNDINSSVITGRILGITKEGHLRLDTEQGEKQFGYGKIKIRKPQFARGQFFEEVKANEKLLGSGQISTLTDEPLENDDNQDIILKTSL